MWKHVNEVDKDLLSGLEKAGFKLDPPGGPGPLFKHYERGGVSVQFFAGASCVIRFLAC